MLGGRPKNVCHADTIGSQHVQQLPQMQIGEIQFNQLQRQMRKSTIN